MSSKIITLLKSDHYQATEDMIAKKIGVQINKEHLEIISEIIKNEIALARIEISEVEQWIVNNNGVLTKFSMLWETSDVARDKSQEGSRDQPRHDDRNVVKKGKGIGFAIGYAIFLILLEKDATGSLLLEYLKKRRIPKASACKNEIIAIHKSIIND